MIFVTSGSMLPFDRLFRIVDEGMARGIFVRAGFDGPVFAQIGDSRYEPKHYEFARFVDKEAFDERVRASRLVIGHAGIGVITAALENKVPLLVLARRAAFGEHVNDHQVSTAVEFERQGHLLSFEEDTLVDKLDAVRHFVPKPRQPNAAAVGVRIGEYLHGLARRRG
jgi:beta-1,4-N-acetylglucosaminyltransferase